MHQRLITTAIIALAVASCQKKASGQTVAVVNNEEITSGELNAALAADPSTAAAGTKEARQAELQKLVDRALLVQQAKKDGIDKSPEYLNRLRMTTDDLLINMLLARRMNTAQLPSAAEISSFQATHPQMFANREIWTLSQIIFPLPKNQAVTAKLQAAKTLDDVAQVLTSTGIQFTRKTNKIDTAAFPNEIYAKLIHLQPGDAFIVPGPTSAVANVITARDPNPTPPDQARTLAVNAMRREQVGKLIQDRVKNLRATAKIEYQPGFAPTTK